MRTRVEAEFTEYVDGRLPALRRTAYFLCGDWHAAEDLVQQALVKVYVAWGRLHTRESLDGYVRQVLVRVYLDERRRPWRRERPADVLPDRPAAADSAYDETDSLMAALADLPVQQRAVVVLRYWEDLSVDETARTLQISSGTVKSHAHRGLAALRAALGSPSGQPADPIVRS